MKRSSLTKILSLFCIVMIMFSMLSGCKTKQDNEGSNVSNNSTTANKVDNSDTDSNKEQDEQNSDSIGFRKLTDKEITLTVWAPFTSTLITGMSENEAFKKIQEETGIKLDFSHPPMEQDNLKQSFNLMIASNNLTDLIFNPPAPYFPGGPDKAVKDGYYLKLNDYIDKYAPNYQKAMNTNAAIRRECITDEGNIWAFSLIQLDKEPPWSGPVIRKDWLDELGLKVPETIAEWETVLTEFKNKKNATAPLAFGYNWRYTSNSAFASAYGASLAKNNLDFFIKDGTDVVYGPIEPGFKDYISLMNNWYEKGLIDLDFAIRDTKSFNALVSSGQAGAFIDGYGNISKIKAAAIETDPKCDFIAAPMPVINKGDELHIRQSNPYIKPYFSIITSECKYPEEAVQLLDLFYSDEGFYLFNYGIEGKTYTLEEGSPEADSSFFPEHLRNKKPVFTDFMLNNPDGTDFWVLMDKYKAHVLSGMLRNPLSYQLSPEVMDAMKIWGESASDDWVLPSVVLTDEENREYSTIMTEVQTYQEEMMFKMILSVEPIENFDKYVNEIKAMGIERALEIKKAAYERYLNR